MELWYVIPAKAGIQNQMIHEKPLKAKIGISKPAQSIDLSI